MSQVANPKRSTRLCVVPEGDGWAVRREGSARNEHFPTQAEALEAAKGALREAGGQLVVQGRNGRERVSFTLGRKGMTKLAAVEGIVLSPNLKRTLKDFDRKGLSSEERRRAVAQRFGKAAG